MRQSSCSLSVLEKIVRRLIRHLTSAPGPGHSSPLFCLRRIGRLRLAGMITADIEAIENFLSLFHVNSDSS